jgi:hypothetical protein
MGFALQSLPPSPPSAAQKQATVGKWEWTMSMGLMRKKIAMEVQEREGKFAAVITLDDGTKLQAKDVQVTEDRIQFVVQNDLKGRMITIKHEGKLKDHKITGTFQMSGGPMDINSKWEAFKIGMK